MDYCVAVISHLSADHISSLNKLTIIWDTLTNWHSGYILVQWGLHRLTATLDLSHHNTTDEYSSTSVDTNQVQLQRGVILVLDQ